MRRCDEEYTYLLNSFSTGMIQNSVAALAVIDRLKLDVDNKMTNLVTFKAFNKVLELKEIVNSNQKVTLMDDTHNASLPAMINAIEAFNKQSQFYKGRKIIALGQISDLGDHTEEVHQQLVSVLETSNADIILLTDDPMRKVMRQIKHPCTTWYKNSILLKEDLLHLADDDSFILLKSSVTGTPFPKMVSTLPSAFKENKNEGIRDFKSYLIKKGESYALICDGKVIESKNWVDSQTIEGLAPVIYYILAKTQLLPSSTVLKKWPTNDKKFKEGITIKTEELVESMKYKPHPSQIYQLSNLLFKNEQEREAAVTAFISQYELNPYASVNLTGRFRKKERQRFGIDDLYKILLKNQTLLFQTGPEFMFGDQAIHGFKKTEQGVWIFSSIKSSKRLEQILNRI